jgi:hypothetical protein
MAPANTGRDSRRSTVVTTRDQTKRGIRSPVMPCFRVVRAVTRKLIEPRIELAPARCNEKIAMSTAGPLWNLLPASGGYTVHPVPTPWSTSAEPTKRISEGGRSQNLRLFSRGKDMSGEPIISGINQLPNPPTKTGITRKKIMRNACAVTKTLYN